MPHRYAIALGSNRRHGRHGAPVRVIAAALATLQAEGVEIVATSAVYATAPIGPSGRAFANAAAILSSDLDPAALLRLLKRIERDFGRRRGRRWGARVIDLDILFWSGGVWPLLHRRAHPGGLTVPHRAMSERSFVLRPLAAIAPGWRHPVLRRSVRQLLARLERRSPVDRTPAAS
jgi:2-amino-4-hydroxy-6-hydroxymethyldihydropteridine diphosphokinase